MRLDARAPVISSTDRRDIVVFGVRVLDGRNDLEDLEIHAPERGLAQPLDDRLVVADLFRLPHHHIRVTTRERLGVEEAHLDGRMLLQKRLDLRAEELEALFGREREPGIGGLHQHEERMRDGLGDGCHKREIACAGIAFQCNLGKDSLLVTANLDLNLLHALDALLQDGSVTKAAERAKLTTPAMSRALGRLRAVLSDELLVRAGRGMVLTPAAIGMREQVHAATAGARAALSRNAAMPLELIDRTLTVRCNDAVAALLVAPLAHAAEREAPRVRARFVQEGFEDAASLRDGRVDLDIGVIDFLEPELRTKNLLTDRFVGVVRKSHPLLTKRVTAQRFAAQRHVAVSRRGRALGPIDEALQERGVAREVVAVVPDFLAALHAVARSNLVTAMPELLAIAATREIAIASFALPVPTPAVAVAMAWHPRFDDEPAHRWLRKNVESLIRSYDKRGAR